MDLEERSDWAALPDLKQYFLNENVNPTGKTLGKGCFGVVIEVKYQQITCAAKCMDEKIMTSVNSRVDPEIIERYHSECQMMAGLRHPNITQFLGLSFLEGSDLPILVMERLEMSVNDLLKCAPDVPLPIKMSILNDTCSGLVYLHGMPKPIIHRDLTANNILLTASLSAKISDLGNSRIVSMNQFVKLTKAPGTIVYMPPEAFLENCVYGVSLDVFSFGHLALYTLTQVFPGKLLHGTEYRDGNDVLQPLNEVARRRDYIQHLCHLYNKSYPLLVQLVYRCLENEANARPSSKELLSMLQPLKRAIEKAHDEDLEILNVAHVLLIKEINEKDTELDMKRKEIELLKESEETLEKHNHDIMTENERLKKEIESLKSHSRSRLTSSNSEWFDQSAKASPRSKLTSSNSEYFSQSDEASPVESDRYVEEDDNLILQPLSPSDWRRTEGLPVAMDGYIQSVLINRTLYVSGGDSDRSENEYKVYAYEHSGWNELLPHCTRGFAMTSIYDKQLVVIGGYSDNKEDSRALSIWQRDDFNWKTSLPPMSVQRWWPSATSYKHWLVVAGGCHLRTFLSSVEILDLTTNQWSSGPSMPISWHSVKSINIRGVWYLMGGHGNVRDVYGVSLKHVTNVSQTSGVKIWKKLASLDCVRATPLSINGHILAVGGYSTDQNKIVSTIQHYDPELKAWVQAGQLPYELQNCTCLTDTEKIFLIGGQSDKGRQREMFTTQKSIISEFLQSQVI